MQEIILDRVNSLKISLGQLKEQQDQLIEDTEKSLDIKNAILLADIGQMIDQIIEDIDNLDTLIQNEMPIDLTTEDTDNEDTEDNDTFLDYNPYYTPYEKAKC